MFHQTPATMQASVSLEVGGKSTPVSGSTKLTYSEWDQMINFNLCLSGLLLSPPLFMLSMTNTDFASHPAAMTSASTSDTNTFVLSQTSQFTGNAPCLCPADIPNDVTWWVWRKTSCCHKTATMSSRANLIPHAALCLQFVPVWLRAAGILG